MQATYRQFFWMSSVYSPHQFMQVLPVRVSGTSGLRSSMLIHCIHHPKAAQSALFAHMSHEPVTSRENSWRRSSPPLAPVHSARRRSRAASFSSWPAALSASVAFSRSASASAVSSTLSAEHVMSASHTARKAPPGEGSTGAVNERAGGRTGGRGGGAAERRRARRHREGRRTRSRPRSRPPRPTWSRHRT